MDFYVLQCQRDSYNYTLCVIDMAARCAFLNAIYFLHVKNFFSFYLLLAV